MCREQWEVDSEDSEEYDDFFQQLATRFQILNRNWIMFSRIADTIGYLPTQAQWELDTFHEFARQVDEGW